MLVGAKNEEAAVVPIGFPPNTLGALPNGLVDPDPTLIGEGEEILAYSLSIGVLSSSEPLSFYYWFYPPKRLDPPLNKFPPLPPPNDYAKAGFYSPCLAGSG
jgi:hypothetical protein